MVNSKSAKKRILVNNRNKLQNKFYKSSSRTLIKIYFKVLNQYKISKTLEKKQSLKKILNSFYSIMDKGTKRGVFHKNTAARKKRRLSKYFKLV